MDTPSIIDRLGGTSETAKLCNVQSQAVSLWRRVGIPPRHWLCIVAHARTKNIDGIDYDALQEARRAHKATA